MDSKFERIGINRLYDTTNTKEAHKSFTKSCECCSAMGRHSDCNRCAIAYTYNLLTAYFTDKECDTNEKH